MPVANVGAWLQTGSPECAEIMASCGFDWVCVDLEHGAVGAEALPNLFRAIERFDTQPWARVADHSVIGIRRALDAGAEGIIVPDVQTVEQVKDILAATRQKPDGVRGLGYSRANVYGNRPVLKASTPSVVIQIEDVKATWELQEMAAVPGLFGMFIGPLDLSGSMGIFGQTEHEQIRSVRHCVVDACQRHGILAGCHVVRPDLKTVHARITEGFKLIALGTDGVFVAEGAQAALRTLVDG